MSIETGFNFAALPPFQFVPPTGFELKMPSIPENNSAMQVDQPSQVPQAVPLPSLQAIPLVAIQSMPLASLSPSPTQQVQAAPLKQNVQQPTAVKDLFLQVFFDDAPILLNGNARVKHVSKELEALASSFPAGPAMLRGLSFPSDMALEKVLFIRQWLKDQNFLLFFYKLASIFPQAKLYLEENAENSDKPDALRKWLSAHRHILQDCEQLDLEGSGLIEVPYEINLFTNLQELILRDNRLRTVPAWIFQLQNLRTLNLGMNQLQDIPDSVGQLVNLECLLLDNNQLSAVPASLGQLANLKVLGLDYNQIEAIPHKLGNLLKLQILFLNNNQIGFLPSRLGSLAKLEILYLDHNQLSTIPENFSKLANLKILYLDHNSIQSIPKKVIDRFRTLEELRLGHNPIQS